MRGDAVITLASSRPFTMPTLLDPPGHTSVSRETLEKKRADAYYPLARLSGAEDFQVLRNGDRLSRGKQKRGTL
jgi:hypothetical protein